MTTVVRSLAPEATRRDDLSTPDSTTRRLRVMQVVLQLGPGGTERLVIEIVRSLAQTVDMSVCCLDEPGAWAGELTSQGVPVVGLGRRPGFRPGLAYRLARLIKHEGVNVLHCHHYSPFVYGQFAALLRPGLRVVFTEHGRLSDDGPSPKRRLVNPWLGRLPHQIFAVSEDLRRHMAGEGLPENRIEVVYNGIAPGRPPTALEREAARTSLGIPGTEIVLGTVGRLDSVKDLPTMIRALRSARSAGAQCRLVIVGDGPEASALRNLASALELGQAVQFTGYRADARTLMPAFDLYVNSSIHEGISLTILEAMAALLPVIATRVGGNPEVVVDGQTGVLVPPRDVSAFAQVVEDLCRAPQRWGTMGSLARARVLDSFGIDRMIARYLDSYSRSRH
jgi:glycosyltransferase involved in cell wall biosynthesis